MKAFTAGHRSRCNDPLYFGGLVGGLRPNRVSSGHTRENALAHLEVAGRDLQSVWLRNQSTRPAFFRKDPRARGITGQSSKRG